MLTADVLTTTWILMSTKKIYCAVFLLILSAVSYAQESAGTVVSQSASDDELKVKVKAEVRSLFGTIEGQRDVDRLADYTHPKALEKAGGRDFFIEVMKRALDDAKVNFDSIEWTIGDSIEIIVFDRQFFALVPRTLKGTTVAKKRIVQEGTVVGISNDQGKTWKFINGTGFNSTFPEYSEKVRVPAQKTFIDGIQQ